MLIGLLLVVGIACCVIPVSATDMMFRFNATHSGDYTPVAGTTGTTLVKIWNYTTEGPVLSSPAVVNGVVYAGSRDGKIYALDAATGAQKWNYSTGGQVDSSPAVANGI